MQQIFIFLFMRWFYVYDELLDLTCRFEMRLWKWGMLRVAEELVDSLIPGFKDSDALEGKREGAIESLQR